MTLQLVSELLQLVRLGSDGDDLGTLLVREWSAAGDRISFQSPSH